MNLLHECFYLYKNVLTSNIINGIIYIYQIGIIKLIDNYMKKDIFDILGDMLAITILFIMISPIVLLFMGLFRGLLWLIINI